METKHQLFFVVVFVIVNVPTSRLKMVSVVLGYFWPSFPSGGGPSPYASCQALIACIESGHGADCQTQHSIVYLLIFLMFHTIYILYIYIYIYCIHVQIYFHVCIYIHNIYVPATRILRYLGPFFGHSFSAFWRLTSLWPPGSADVSTFRLSVTNSNIC